LTTDLLASGQLKPGLTTFLDNDDALVATPETAPIATPAPPLSRSLLLVRSMDGVYDGEFDTIDIPFLADLNALLDSFLETVDQTPTISPEAGTPAGPEESPFTPTSTPSP
jgi:hypothetical protein